MARIDQMATVSPSPKLIWKKEKEAKRDVYNSRIILIPI